MEKNYIINPKTSALISHFHNGHEYSQILEGKDIFIVEQSPREIVEESFLRTGSDLDGAIKSARFILQKKYKLPVALSPENDIILIRCKAKNKEGSVWLINSHIQQTHPYEKNQTIVYTKAGLSLIVDMNPDILQTRRTQASFLQTDLLDQAKTEKHMTFFYEKNSGIMLIKPEGHVNYTVKKKEEDGEKLEKDQ